MTHAADPVGTLEVALAHAARLLEAQPKLAADQAEEILKVLPEQPTALLLLGLAKRALGQSGEAMAPLRRAVALKKVRFTMQSSCVPLKVCAAKTVHW